MLQPFDTPMIPGIRHNVFIQRPREDEASPASAARRRRSPLLSLERYEIIAFL